MPFVHIRIAGIALDASGVERLRERAVALMAGVLRKDRHLTAVLVEDHPVERWSVGGQGVEAAAHLVATVTAGTNDAHEKAAFIRRAHALLAETVGDGLSPATYGVVEEVAAESWGYGGLTQAARRAS